MFYNISNHPSSKWGEKQMSAALAADNEAVIGIVDMPFPNVDPHAGMNSIRQMAIQFMDIQLPQNLSSCTCMVQGEMSLTAALVRLIQERGGTAVCATTERKVVENADGSKTVSFEFVRFRSYVNLT